LYVKPASIYEYGTTTKVGTTTMLHTGSTSVYSFTNTMALSANKWYELRIVGVDTSL